MKLLIKKRESLLRGVWREIKRVLAGAVLLWLRWDEKQILNYKAELEEALEWHRTHEEKMKPQRFMWLFDSFDQATAAADEELALCRRRIWQVSDWSER